jgi:hypothetical protein
MANAQKPTTQTRHMDIKYHVLCEWVERDLLVLSCMDTLVNMSDHFTKQLGPILFHCHVDYIMGQIPPHYTQWFRKLFGSTSWAVPARTVPASAQPIAVVAAGLYAHWLPVLTGVC